MLQLYFVLRSHQTCVAQPPDCLTVNILYTIDCRSVTDAQSEVCWRFIVSLLNNEDFRRNDINNQTSINGQEIEIVKEYKYLGSIIDDFEVVFWAKYQLALQGRPAEAVLP